MEFCVVFHLGIEIFHFGEINESVEAREESGRVL